ncbi:hypothetical protein [Streptomyces malaysiensis]|uniref:Uncharacterized protein n=1 Tax=Streptomyces malaysiensis subsp. samsunensis TaxID=459658 RepID=A0A9X2M6M4_STRMQ|nr:hypothetical protein [Streptomyces samsunensis]MCQ8836403.1 hypothetical protein [Streptomyces samsunensis]
MAWQVIWWIWSHLHTAALDVFLRPVDMVEVLAVARDDLGPGGREPTVELSEDLPDVLGDAALLTRVVTNPVAYGCGAVPPVCRRRWRWAHCSCSYAQCPVPPAVRS